MTIGRITEILGARVIVGEPGQLESVVTSGCSSDMMSDVLAFVKNQSVLLTGIVNPQVVRTAHMMDMVCIIFTRGKGKNIDENTLSLAKEYGIVLLDTEHRMFTATGMLFQAGLRGGD